ncbi:MAG TPA: YhjD/YihY/BrkB family envelope integrity protein [Ktedonobacterales bacterium]
MRDERGGFARREEGKLMAWWFWNKYDRDWGWNLARLLAFTLLESLFAMAGLQLVLLALALRLTTPYAERTVSFYLAHFLPDRVATSAVLAFTHSLRTAPAYLLVLGLPVAVWYGSRFFAVLESVLCVIFRRTKRRFLPQNRAAFLMLLLCLTLLPIIVFSATAIPHIGVSISRLAITLVDSDAFGGSVWAPWLALLAGLLANFVLALVAFIWLTPGGVSLRAAWPGALVAAALSQGYLLIFPLYVRYVLQPAHFGSIAGFALVALVFFYAYGLFIVIGAEIAAIRMGYAPSSQDLTGIVAKSELPSAPPARQSLIPLGKRDVAALGSVTIPTLEGAPTAHDAPTDPWLDAARRVEVIE